MSALAWWQDVEFAERMRLLQEGFFDQSGYSAVGWACVVIIVGAIVLIIVSRVQRRVSGELIPNDPRGLFHTVLEQLTLSPDERSAVELMAREAKLRHPTALLLAPKLFDLCAEQSLMRQVADWDATRARRQTLLAARARLFGGDAPLLGTKPTV